MKLALLVVTILAISTAIPAGILLASFTSKESVKPYLPNNGAIQLPELRRVPEPPKEDALIKPPEAAKAIEPPKLDMPNVIQQQPPNNQMPQIQQQQITVIQVKPPGYVHKITLLRIARAQGIEGRDYVRVQLTDVDLAPYQQLKGSPRAPLDANRTFSLKQALEEIDVRATHSESQCRSFVDKRFCPERPMLHLELTEDQTVAFVNLANPLLNSTSWFRQSTLPNGDHNRSWDSVIVYNEVRYLVMIDSVWSPP